MDDTNPSAGPTPTSSPAASSLPEGASLSYKFERLREKIRAAIAAGELTGRLPGERILSRRFHANPKTLSKALSDLAAEGLLQRRVGQGTFVATDAPSPVGHWLILCGPETSQPLLSELLRLLPDARCCSDGEPLRPSALVQVSGVLSLRNSLESSMLRDLQVRGVPIVETRDTSSVYSTHAVTFDRERAAFELGRRLLRLGHRRIAAVEAPGNHLVRDALSQAALQCEPDAVILPCEPGRVVDIAMNGVTAWVCHNTASALAAHRDLVQSITLLLRDDFSIAAIDELPPEDAAYTGWYLGAAAYARQIVGLLPALQPHRRSILCLKGEFVERGTLLTVAPQSVLLPERNPMAMQDL